VTVLAGLFLVAHGLVHLAIWLPAAKDDAPFDPRNSWLAGELAGLSRALAVIAAVLLAAAGILVLSGAEEGAGVAIAGAAASLLLILLTFHPWFLAAIAIDVAIVVVAAT
jgi:hypothetical protein